MEENINKRIALGHVKPIHRRKHDRRSGKLEPFEDLMIIASLRIEESRTDPDMSQHAHFSRYVTKKYSIEFMK